MWANRPCNLLSSLRFLGVCISWMTQTFSGLRWIPLDVTTNPRNLLLATPGRTWLGSPSAGASAWYQILSSDLLYNHLCRVSLQQYHLRSILRSCVFASGRSFSWRVGMSDLQFSSQRASRRSIILLVVFWKMYVSRLLYTFWFDYIRRSRP